MTDEVYQKIYDYVTAGHFEAVYQAIPGTNYSPDIVSAGILKAVELEPEFAKELESFWLRFTKDDLGEWEYQEDFEQNQRMKEYGQHYYGYYNVPGLTKDFILIEKNKITGQTIMCFNFER